MRRLKHMKKIAFIGQAMPKPPYPDKPFGRTHLYTWFESIGVTDKHIQDNFTFSAIVSYFPGSKNGSHIVPSESEILKERPNLIKFLLTTMPDVVVPVGKLAIGECLKQKVESLNNFIGEKYMVDPFGVMGSSKIVIPLPHPSGASSWFYKEENKRLLGKALNLIKTELY